MNQLINKCPNVFPYPQGNFFPELPSTNLNSIASGLPHIDWDVPEPVKVERVVAPPPTPNGPVFMGPTDKKLHEFKPLYPETLKDRISLSQEMMRKIREGVAAFNQWRSEYRLNRDLSLEGTPPIDVSGLDLTGINLSNIAFPMHSKFDGTNLTRADLQGTNLFICSMNGTILDGARINRDTTLGSGVKSVDDYMAELGTVDIH